MREGGGGSSQNRLIPTRTRASTITLPQARKWRWVRSSEGSGITWALPAEGQRVDRYEGEGRSRLGDPCAYLLNVRETGVVSRGEARILIRAPAMPASR